MGVGGRRLAWLAAVLAAVALPAGWMALRAAQPAAVSVSSPAPGDAAPAPGPGPEPEQPAPPPHYDLLIRGGTIVDGTGAPRYLADLAINGDQIVQIGDLHGATANRVIDAAGLMVAPGFINPHSHTWDPDLITDPDATASLMQGLTTEIGGADGRSVWPVGEGLARIAAEGTGVNFATMAGHGTVRYEIMGWGYRHARPAEVERMEQMLARAMAEGALGVSTGLEYDPGRHGSTEELIAAARVAAAHGGVYASHIRNEGDGIIGSVAEVLRIGREAGLPVVISHFKVVWPRNWEKLPAVLQMIRNARAAGQQVGADLYPYLAPDYASYLPLRKAAGLARPEQVIIRAAADPALLDRTLAEIAAARGQSPGQTVNTLLAADPEIKAVAEVVSQAQLWELLAADFTVVGTDGGSKAVAEGTEAAFKVHPRAYGSFPRVLQWVREGRLDLSWEAAIRKMSGATADFYGLERRGYLQPGFYADLVIFDPATVADQTTWTHSRRFPTGIRYVLVNGVPAVEQGERVAGVRAGRVLKRAGTEGTGTAP